MWFDILKIDTEGLPPGLQKIIDEYEVIKPEDTRTPFERSWDLARSVARKLDNIQIVKDEIHMRPPWLLKWLKSGQHRTWKTYWDDIMDGKINNFWLSFPLDTKRFCITLNFIYPVGNTRRTERHDTGQLCLRPSTDYPMGDHYVSTMLRAGNYENWNSMW
jgi:hypothetical protein